MKREEPKQERVKEEKKKEEKKKEEKKKDKSKSEARKERTREKKAGGGVGAKPLSMQQLITQNLPASRERMVRNSDVRVLLVLSAVKMLHTQIPSIPSTHPPIATVLHPS